MEEEEDNDYQVAIDLSHYSGVLSVANDVGMATNTPWNIRTRHKRSKARNSPNGLLKIEPSRCDALLHYGIMFYCTTT